MVENLVNMDIKKILKSVIITMIPILLKTTIIDHFKFLMIRN